MTASTAALLYLAATLSANAGDIPAVSELREGDMKKLVFHEAPQAASDEIFFLPDESEHSLGNFSKRLA